ncbi:MAG TPA: glucose-6-phosphate isomerase [Ureibacillus sp.]|nr:glucose-6-phosphate isomerase [Ureibacillus sp.]
MSHLHLRTNLDGHLLSDDVMDYRALISNIHRYLEEGVDEFTGWINAPIDVEEEQINAILGLTDEIKQHAEVLIVVGIGGSYLGAKAVQEALSPYFKQHENGIEVMYVGYNLSGNYMKQVIDSLENREFYINVVSKSGSTMESSIAFRVLRQFAEARYGTESKKRIIVTTDPKKSLLKDIALTQGYRTFEIPSNIGGRYSTLTPVGLLPMAVGGIDIIQLLEGAKRAALHFKEEELIENEAYQYAMYRHKLHMAGFQVELLASFEPSLAYIHEWWKQLFGESEGKAKKGLFPASVSYSTDLHSLGQFVQEGNPILFETFLHFRNVVDDFYIPYNDLDDDSLNYLSHRSFNEINRISEKGTIIAHSEGGVPIIQIELEKLDAFHIGYLIYFFMKACTMSAYLIDVYPFDQPGVEAYKRKITQLLTEESVVK